MDSPSLVSDESSWSKLPLDLLNMVFERLGFRDFQQAKSVCLAWLHASRQSTPNNLIPWLIMFPEKGKDYCLLFNPEEKEKVYKIRDLGDEFTNSRCLAIYGSWFFMTDPKYNFYIMNLFTRERISLPSVESQTGRIMIERTINDMFRIKTDDKYFRYSQKYIDINLPILWIDEKTKDYVVMWLIQKQYEYLVYCRNGDNLWKHANYYYNDMVYKDHKIYLYNSSRDVKVLEFSGDIPRQIFETQVNYDKMIDEGLLRQIEPGDVWHIKRTHLVVTITGEPLKVKSLIWSDSDVWSFRIYKLNSSNTDWEKLTSLGDEAVLLDQGITVIASSTEGINRNSIYFSGHHLLHYSDCDRVWSMKDIFVFDLDTQEVERTHQSIYSSIQLSDARWFVPNFKHR